MNPNKMNQLNFKPSSEPSPLDFVDVDPTFHTMTECFPDVPKDAIFDAVEEADGDFNKAFDIIMTTYSGDAQQSDETSDDVDVEDPSFKISSLAEAFPHIDVEIISKTLLDCDNDSEKAIESLLNHDIIVEFEQKLELEEINKNQNSNRTWVQVNERIYHISELLQVELNVAKSYYHKNGGNIVQALVDIIYNLRNEEKRAKEQLKPKATNNIPYGGRVQNNSSSSKPVYKGRRKRRNSETNQEYVYNENSPEVSELASLIYDDPHLVNINWEFNQEALVFFKGNVTNVIALDLFIVEHNGVKETYQNESKTISINNNNNNRITTPIKPPSFKFTQVLPKPTSTVLRSPSIEDDLTSQQIALQRVQLRKCREINKLDLHGFHVKNARDTTAKALRDWWQDELKAREASGRAAHGAKAREVEPFIVVTGKGLHSEGGVSKIRASIKKWMKNSEFYALEEEARFVVIGLKS